MTAGVSPTETRTRIRIRARWSRAEQPNRTGDVIVMYGALYDDGIKILTVCVYVCVQGSDRRVELR